MAPYASMASDKINQVINSFLLIIVRFTNTFSGTVLFSIYFLSPTTCVTLD